MKNSLSGKIELLVALLCTQSIYLSSVPQYIMPNNMIYAIEHFNTYDRSIFNDNIVIGGGVSSKYIINHLFAYCMKLSGGNWQNIAAPFIYFSVAMLTIATVTLAYRITYTNRIFYSVILAFFFTLSTSKQVGDFLLFDSTILSIGMGMGYALAILAISFSVGDKRNYNISWVLLSAAALMHIHEGLYGFAAVSILVLSDCIYNKKISYKKNWTIIIFLMTILMTVLPNMFTDHMSITGEEFVNIYAFYRHPHHLVPSSWGIERIAFSLLWIIFPALIRTIQLYYMQKKDDLKKYIVEVILIIVAWCGIIVSMYLGTEKLNSVLITTLYLVKFLKYVQIFSLIWYIKIVRDYLQNCEYACGFIVLLFALSANTFGRNAIIVFLILLVVLRQFANRKRNIAERDYVIEMLMGPLCISIVILYPGVGMRLCSKIVLTIIGGGCILWYLYCISKKKFLLNMMPFLMIVMALVASYGHFYKISGGKLYINTPRKILIDSCGADAYEMALEFKKLSFSGDLFLADPQNKIGGGWIQVVSERSCYVLYKVVPSSKERIKEWYDRYQETENLFEKDCNEIAEIMSRRNISYLLVDQNNYEKIDESGIFEVYISPAGDSMRMYRIRQGN